MEKKKVTFRLFVVKNEELTHDASDLKDVLRAKLGSIEAEKRLIRVRNDEECKENDFLSSFAPATGINPESDYIYGVIMRLKPAKGIKALPENFLQMIELTESDLEDIPEIAGKIVCSHLYHFLIKGKYVITDLPQIMTISSFQRYINTLLVDRKYGFAPLIYRDLIRLNELRSVTFSDSFPNNYGDDNRIPSLKKMTNSLIKGICPGVKRLNTIMDDKIISAKMKIEFSRPKGMTEEVYANKLSAILAPVQDLHNVHFTFADGKKLTGADLAYSQKVELKDETGITPLTYISKMREIIDSIIEE